MQFEIDGFALLMICCLSFFFFRESGRWKGDHGAVCQVRPER